MVSPFFRISQEGLKGLILLYIDSGKKQAPGFQS